MHDRRDRPVIDKILPWTAGITIPLLIVIMSALWGMSSQMSARASEAEVQKVRTDQLERAILDIKMSANQIDNTVKSLEISQTRHNTLMESKIDHIRKDVDELKRRKYLQKSED